MPFGWISDDDRKQFHEDGYMVIRGVIPASLAENAVREIAAFVGADLDDWTTWYGGAPELDGIVPMHHAQSLWEIRQCPDLYHVFTEFFGNPRLMVDMNRCIFRPPIHPRWPTVSYGSIHWDTDPRKSGPGSLQAVVLLTDVDPNGGGFQCLPDVYRNLDKWLEQYASDRGECRGCHSMVDPTSPWNGDQLVIPPEGRVVRFDAASSG